MMEAQKRLDLSWREVQKRLDLTGGRYRRDLIWSGQDEVCDAGKWTRASGVHFPSKKNRFETAGNA